ncbi:putative glycosyltransferase [Streptococcus pneumoniae]|nr:putative glycosyltransferase [Streptococcus pneumoniae]
MENELISIVVPIYNVENYLRMCLDSIQNQTYQNFECLLINDGSPDHSSKICEEFVEKDSRFKYFEKANGGLSSARNLGIECSGGGGGAYITFVDSDDWLEHDALDRLYGALKKENADISIGRYNSYDETRYVYMTYVTDPDDSLEVIEGKAIMDREGVEEVRNGNWTVAVLKLFKRELLQDLPFPIGKIAEDTYWTWKVLLRASRIVYLNRCVYWYRVGLSDTLSNTWSEKRMYDEIGAREEKIAILASSDYDLTNHILIYKNRLQRVIAKLEEQNMQFTEIYRRMMEKLSLLP